MGLQQRVARGPMGGQRIGSAGNEWRDVGLPVHAIRPGSSGWMSGFA